MERDNGPGPDHRRADAVRLALDAIEELNETGSSASVMRKLAAARLALAPEAGSEPSRRGSAEPGSAEPRPFGAFAGRFTIGPEFFEPLSRDDLRGWTAE